MTSDQKYDVESKGPPLSSSLSATPSSLEPVSLGIPLEKRLLREIAATIKCVLLGNWLTFTSTLGYSEESEENADQSHCKPTSKIFKVLQRNAAQHYGDTDEWWKQFLKQLTSFGNADLTTRIKSVYDKWKESQSQHSARSSFDKVYPELQSNGSFSSGFNHIPNDSDHRKERDDNIVPDRPEISMEINVVAEALDRVSNNPATAGITKWLRDGVPRIIQLERDLKSQKALRGIFENESSNRKSEIEELQKQMDLYIDQTKKLTLENQELKKAKQDEQLNEFDFVTRKEAQDIKHEEHVTNSEKLHSAADGVMPRATKDEITGLKNDKHALKKQIAEIVKVNHSWDEHYKKMKGQLEKQVIDLRKEVDTLLSSRLENEELKTELAVLQQKMENNDKEKDALLIQAKDRIERTEKDKAEKQKELDVVRQKFDKVQGYARTLTNQRKEAESEINRLNEVLAQNMSIVIPAANGYQQRQTSPVQSRFKNIQAQQKEGIPSGIESLLTHSLEIPQKRVESMTEVELREELELLRQQTDLFRSDFNHEREDRQRVMGELDETKKDLKKYQHKLEGYRVQHTTKSTSKYRQVLEDEKYAKQLQRQEEDVQRPMYRNTGPMVKQRPYQQPRYQAQPQQNTQPRYYSPADEMNAGQMPQRGMLPHGGPGYYYGPSRNYAANDVVIDGADVVDGSGGMGDTDRELEIDGTSDENGPANGVSCDNMTCQRCKRSFSQDEEYRVHINRCIAD